MELSERTRRLLLTFFAFFHWVCAIDLLLGLLILGYMTWAGYTRELFVGGVILAGVGTFGFTQARKWQRWLQAA